MQSLHITKHCHQTPSELLFRKDESSSEIIWIEFESHHSKKQGPEAKQKNKNRNPLKIQMLIANI